jgi:hypothetical protein
VQEHKGIKGNETADQLTKWGSLHPFIGPEPICGMSGRVAVINWMCKEHYEYWQSYLGQRHAKQQDTVTKKGPLLQTRYK